MKIMVFRARDTANHEWVGYYDPKYNVYSVIVLNVPLQVLIRLPTPPIEDPKILEEAINKCLELPITIIATKGE